MFSLPQSFPRRFALKDRASNRYLRYVDEAGPLQTYLEFSGDDVLSPLCRFEGEPSALNPRTHMHIRCAFNSKYLVCTPDSGLSVAAQADKPSDAGSVFVNTSYVPTRDPAPGRYNIVTFHHFSGVNLRQRSEPGSFRHNTLYLFNFTARYSMEVVDLDEVTVFPTLFALRDSVVQMHLASGVMVPSEYLIFSVPQSAGLGSPSAFQAIRTGHGQHRIRSSWTLKYWIRKDTNRIVADASDYTVNDPNTLFSAVRFSADTVAIMNQGNQAFCRLDQINNGYWASGTTLDRFTQVSVSEPRVTRSVINVFYRLPSARIYNEHQVVLSSVSASNWSNNQATVDLNLTHTRRESHTWSAASNIKTGVTSQLTAGVPTVTAGGSVQVSSPRTIPVELGVTVEEERTVPVTYIVVVPPRTRVTVSLIATVATCEVGFSCSLSDVLNGWHQYAYRWDNGHYTGVQQFDMVYSVQMQNL